MQFAAFIMKGRVNSIDEKKIGMYFSSKDCRFSSNCYNFEWLFQFECIRLENIYSGWRFCWSERRGSEMDVYRWLWRRTAFGCTESHRFPLIKSTIHLPTRNFNELASTKMLFNNTSSRLRTLTFTSKTYLW